MTPLDILFEDEVILVVNKPNGLMVEPDRNGHLNLLNEVKKHIKENQSADEEVYAQHIHRLDRPVSGIILFAKKKRVLKNLSEQFAERRVKKYYQALTENAPEIKNGLLEHWHRKEKKKAVLYDTEIEYAEKAKLKYEVVEHGKLFLWNIELHTGKYHQIRAQSSSLGCPIMGDALYCSTLSYQENAIALHACKLVFTHPITNQELSIVSHKDF